MPTCWVSYACVNAKCRPIDNLFYCIAGMQHTAAFQSCCVCLHSWKPGVLRNTIYGGYRRFLPVDSRARHKRFKYKGLLYEFSNVEQRTKPKLRSTAFARECLSTMKCLTKQRVQQYTNRGQRGSPPEDQPFLGHKHAPLQAKWPDFDWYRYNIPDLMHGMSL